RRLDHASRFSWERTVIPGWTERKFYDAYQTMTSRNFLPADDEYPAPLGFSARTGLLSPRGRGDGDAEGAMQVQVVNVRQRVRPVKYSRDIHLVLGIVFVVAAAIGAGWYLNRLGS